MRCIWCARSGIGGACSRTGARRRKRWPQPETAGELLASEAFIIVTSYRIPAETSLAAFTAAIEEAARYPNPVTIVAAVVEMAEQRLAKDLFRRLAPPARVRLILVRGKPTGKRDALARALRAVARTAPRPDAVVLVQDGDTILPPGCLARTLPFFRLFPSLAALTTDEDCLVPEAGAAMRAWHRLRFAQRHLLMSSLALSRRLITITGRMSAYRAAVATDPSFIELIGNDTLDHWRFGRLRLLTGEDKSAAYWLLERGLASLYVPDVQVLTIEQPPAPDLLRASTALMLRWFGNMLRASGRCLALGPARVGWFVWWCLLDQRISMWTPLVGPIAAILLAVAVTPAFLYAYLLWVMATRLIQSLLLLTVRPTHQRPVPAASLLLPALWRAAQDLGPVSAGSPALDPAEHRPDALAHPGSGALAGRGIAGAAPAGLGDPGRRPWPCPPASHPCPASALLARLS